MERLRDKGTTEGRPGESGRQVLAGVGVAVVLLGLWQLVVLVFEPPAFILPGPARVAGILAENAAFLSHHAAITLAEILLGLAAGACLGVFSAMVAGYARAAGRIVLPVMVMSQALPVFAIAPLLVIWLGFGIASKVVMATLIIFFPVASSFLDGLRRTDPGLLDLATIAGAPRWRTFSLIRVPAALPGLATGLRVAAAVAPIGAVVGEWVGASAGLGYVMLQANARMQTDLVFAALIALGLTALILRALIDAFARHLVPWAEPQPV